MRRVNSIDGTPIALHPLGDGPPLVLVHGVLSDHRRWAPVLNDFSSHYTVYGMDRRGHGASGDGEQYSIKAEADDIIAVVESTSESPHVVAHSYGAICAMEAATSTDAIEQLVLYEPPIVPGDGPGHPYPPDAVAAINEKARENDPEGILETFYRQAAGRSEAQLDQMKADDAWADRIDIAHTLVREIAAIEQLDFDPSRYEQLHAPTLLLQGSESPSMRTAVLTPLAESIPKVELATLDGQGHIAMVTAPDLFFEEVNAFLSGR